MAVQELDDLKIYRGEDYPINDKITIHIPTLGEVCDYGDTKYFELVHTLTATPSDMMWQLDAVGLDFTEIDNFTLFSQIICAKPDGVFQDQKAYDEAKANFSLTQDKTNILLGDIDLFDFILMKNQENDEICMYNPITDTTIDAYTHRLISNCIRKVHFLTEHIEKPANQSTKEILIEDAKDSYMMNKDKTSSSYLLNLISAMVNNADFKYNHNEVWNMKIYAFLDSVKRVSKIKNANLLLQSGYSGFGVDLKKISDKQIDWLGDL